ncbi:hypothetical protein Tco_0856142 [Tanacetum coccineum]
MVILISLDEAAHSEEVEVQKVRPTGHDKAKKKSSSASVPLESSTVAPLLVDRLVDKWKNVASSLFSKKERS